MHFAVPESLAKFYLFAPQEARTCKKCGIIQIPEHDSAFEYMGDWHWATIRGLNGLPTEKAPALLSDDLTTFKPTSIGCSQK